jgi:hypothetical protein
MIVRAQPTMALDRPSARNCCVLSLLVMTAGTSDTPPAQHQPAKRALIVAISDYHPSTKWSRISSLNDVPLLSYALDRHGFAGSVAVLPQEQATRSGILNAIDEHLLKRAGPGDVLVFHYSGHGQQITDDDGDEPDGYDETIVPYDAPMRLEGGYRGEKHLRDDELGKRLQALRAKVGPAGNVVFAFDSCFSGAITRASAPARGGEPLGEPARAVDGEKSEATGLFEAARPRGTVSAQGEALSPFIVLSASRFNQIDHEMRAPSGELVGPLAYALSVALSRSPGPKTYRSLLRLVEIEMQRNFVPNEPQLEGDVDTEIFSGRAVQQTPFIDVVDVSGDRRRVQLAGGTLLGLNVGTEIEFHQTEAPQPAPSTLLASGTVVSASPIRASVELSNQATEEIRLARAFVTRYTFGTLRMRVQIEPATNKTAASVHDTLSRLSIVELVRERSDLLITTDAGERRDSSIVTVATTGNVMLGPIANSDPDLVRILTDRIEACARNQYLRRLDITHPDLNATLEIVPLALTNCSDQSNPSEETCTVTRATPTAFVSEGNTFSYPAGTYFKLRVTPPRTPAYLAVLDLAPDGTISVLVPEDSRRKETTQPGPPRDLVGLFRMTEPYGMETFLLVSTDSWVDFSVFDSRLSRGARSAPRTADLGAFAPLFDDAAIRNRAARIVPIGAVATHSLSFSVRPR